ncbi:protein fem-1 homolog C-like [Oscarella lobularis]|uniref:protein fem-1 homolog C-like n=1 Tax=Oscarella lobularis TaxID=121494 RepID=UPI003313EEEC
MDEVGVDASPECEVMTKALHMGIETLYGNADRGEMEPFRRNLDSYCGILTQLNYRNGNRSEIIVDLLGTHPRNAGTALLAAARANHVDLVRFMLDECRVDIEQTGKVKSFQKNGYDRFVEGSTPLWIAATGNHVDLVREFARRGADLNHGTKTGSTPFRGACFHGNIEVVTELYHAGCDVNIPNDQNQTALLTACATGKLEVVKFLFGINAKRGKESTGLNELLVAAAYANFTIVEYLITLDEYSKEECVNGLELVGASIVDAEKDQSTVWTAWKMALAMRREFLPESIEILHHNSRRNSAYLNVMEPRDDADLHALVADPDMTLMRALAIRERVLGAQHPFTAHQVRYRAVQYIRYHMYDRCVELMLHSLELQRSVQYKIDSAGFQEDEIILVYARLFNYLHLKLYHSDMEPFFGEAVDQVILAVDEIKCSPSEASEKALNRLLVATLHLLAVWLLCTTSSSGSEELLPAQRELIRRLVRLNLRNSDGQTLLHMACTSKTKGDVTTDKRPMDFPSCHVIDALVQCGSRLNVQDRYRQTPLLLACHPDSKAKPEAIQCLIRNGAYAHCRDEAQQTAFHLTGNRPELNECLAKAAPFKSLQTLAACAIIDHGVEFQENIPRSLLAFVRFH